MRVRTESAFLTQPLLILRQAQDEVCPHAELAEACGSSILPREGAGDGMQLWGCSEDGVCSALFKGTARSKWKLFLWNRFRGVRRMVRRKILRKCSIDSRKAANDSEFPSRENLFGRRLTDCHSNRRRRWVVNTRAAR
jgi:hypothetical protein